MKATGVSNKTRAVLDEIYRWVRVSPMTAESLGAQVIVSNHYPSREADSRRGIGCQSNPSLCQGGGN